MSGPADVSDLRNRSLRPLTSLESSVGAQLLDDAYNIITIRVPSVPARVGAIGDLVVQVQCAMVLRVLRNPDGKIEEALDDYKYRLDTAVSSGALYLTADEMALLGTGDSSSDVAWSIRPGGVAPVATDWWLQ